RSPSLRSSREMQRALLICTVATLGIATALTASVMPAFPAAPADSGSVVGTVTALGGGACLELTNTTVNFGTLPFSTLTQLSSAQGSLTPTFKNCGNFNENISISGSDATGVNPAWQLGSKFAGNPCTDANGTALVNFYGLSFDAPPVGRVSITKTATSIST